MIHVDVRKAENMRGYAIEVSVDGAPFIEHWHLAPCGSTTLEQELSAKSDGRIYAAGIKFGGGDVRMTAFGDDVYVPDMTIGVGTYAAAKLFAFDHRVDP